MAILSMLLILWTLCVVVRLLPHPSARLRAPTHQHQACAQAPSRGQADTDIQDAPAWSALDERQLTRLLTDSAPRTITE